MKEKYLILLIILIHLNIYLSQHDYVYFDLKTFKNNSISEREYYNYFYNTYNNDIYSEISLGPYKEKYIMELKPDNMRFTIFNNNCDIPPSDGSQTSNYLPTLANSTLIEYINDNLTVIEGEYFVSILENTISLQTNNGEINTKIDYVFSPRNDSDYVKHEILRPYTCFSLGFVIDLLSPTDDIDKVDDFALNLIFQFKKNRIISSYNWFIEYDTNNKDEGKLVLGIKPHDYNRDKYKEENERNIKAIKRKDNKIYWDIEVNEVYLKDEENSKILINYLTCSLEPTLGVILGAVGYKIIVEEKLFKPLIDENKCFKSNISNQYIMFYCNKDMKDYIKKNKYINIYFLHRYIGKIFELNFDDLFEEKGKYLYFKVFFSIKENDIWRFGKPFLSKYFFSYDIDGKTISYYRDDTDNINDEKNDNKNNDGGNLTLLLIIIVLLFVIGGIGFIVGKNFYSNNKKQKVEELMDDDYDYDVRPINNINES